MTDAGRDSLEQRVLVLAPTTKDATLTRSVLDRAGVACLCCADLVQLCQELETGAGAVLLAEEAVIPGQRGCLTEWLARQPPWSDLPVLVLARPGADSAAVAQSMDLLGNVMVLERPTRVAGLVSAVRSALRARQRQYQARAHLSQIERSERDLSDFFDNASVGLHWVGPDGILLRANQTELDMLGYGRDEYIGRHIAEFHVDRHVIDDILRRLAAGETLHNVPARMRAKNGAIRDVLINSNVLFQDGVFVHTRCFTRDVTDLNRAHRSLEASEQRFRNIFQNAGVSLWEEDFSGVKAALEALRTQGISDYGRYFQEHPEFVRQAMGAIRVLDVNDATVAMFEANDKRELLGLLPRIFPPESMHVFQAELRALAEGRTWFESEALLNTVRGKPVHVFFTMVLPGPGQPYDRVLFSVLDISRRKQMEDALRQADRRKDEFLAVLAHELRNPLAPIRNSLHILRMTGQHDPAAQRVGEMMERQVNHMVRLVDDLMEVSRITRGKIELRRELVEVAAVVRSAVETSRPLIEAAGHQLAIAIPPEPLVLEGDPVRLAQVFANLLNNAAKYTDAGGQIWLTIRREGEQVVISVRDTGTGIPLDMLPRVFELFMQIERHENRAQGGLGIGLTLVKSLVEMHGGSVQAHSEGPGRGSEFVVRLPLVEARRPREASRTGGPAAVLAPRRVLVVDDNRDAAESLALLLKLLGADVRVAYSGPEALEALATYKPAVLLLDIGMPGMDGHEVARRIRERSEFQNVTLIALTGWGQDEDRRRSQTAGFDYHLIKPADISALQTLLVSLDERKASSRTKG